MISWLVLRPLEHPGSPARLRWRSGRTRTSVRNRGAQEKGGVKDAIEVLPVEDLMHEHGVLKRVLLTYDLAEYTPHGSNPW